MSTSPARHLSVAAEAVRSFNHTSRQAQEDWEYPSASYTALGHMSYLTQILAQAIDQCTRPVMYTYEHGRVLIDGRGDPDAAVAELVAAREQAMAAAAVLTSAVQRMHNATGPMGFDTEGLPEFADEVHHE